LHTMFHIDPRLGMLITALIIVPYTVYGGFRSVVYTDVVQAIVMITALIVGPIMGMYYIAHTPDLFATSISSALDQAGPSYASLLSATSGFAAGVIILGGFSWFFGFLGGQPQLSMRFMAIRNPKQAKQGRNIGIVWSLIAYTGALAIGWIGIAIFGPQGLTDPEYVMPAVMLRIFPPAIAAILITGAIAAMISTADSLLILSATELSENLLGQNKACDPKKSLMRCRIVTAILAIVALALAYLFPATLIYTLVGYVWAGIGGTFSVIILYTLFWKRFNGTATIVTIVAGMLFTIIWISTGLDKVITARVMTFVFSAIVATTVTLFSTKR